MLVQPSYASAGLFSNIAQVLNPQTQAAELVPPAPEVIHNSQTVPLLESSINPDLKNIKEEPPALIVSSSDPIALENNGTLDTDSELEKYDPSEKISTYVVKKGDTLESIAKKLKVTQSAILASNADLKRSDLLKIGQKLAVIALKADIDKATKADEKADQIAKADISDKKATTDKKEETVKTPEKDPVPGFVINTDLPSPSVTVSAPSLPTTAPVQNGQPAGGIDDGYIWPLPAGVGRISQGLHGDNAYDFAAPKNTPIYAIQSGTVLIVHPTGYNGGYGKYVVINFDDGRQAIFGHMNQTVAQEGQIVKKGDLIGYLGNTGKSTGPHVHIGFHGKLSNPYVGLKVNNTSEDFQDHD